MIRRRHLLQSFLAGSLFASASSSQETAEQTLEVGQLMLTGFRGLSPSDSDVDRLRRHIERGEVAGVILLERNVQSPEQLSRLTSALQDASPRLPLIISVDQEGGEVARLGLGSGFMGWMSPAEMADSGLSDDEVLAYYYYRANELAEVGINLNLGPVVDLNVNPFNPIIGSKERSFGHSVERVVRLAELFILAHREAGVKTCLKHFPGHGSSMTDSHLGSADVSATWSPEEIAPFERLVRAGLADTVMNAHLLHKYLSDAPWIPTSLSTRSVTEIRQGLAFDGPIITDDMQMGAITDFAGAVDAGVRALSIGNSLLIYSNYKDRYSLQSVLDLNRALQYSISIGRLGVDSVASSVTVVESFRSSIAISPASRRR